MFLERFRIVLIHKQGAHYAVNYCNIGNLMTRPVVFQTSYKKTQKWAMAYWSMQTFRLRFIFVRVDKLLLTENGSEGWVNHI